MEITLTQFQKYEAVRKSGACNMFLSRQVSELSGLKVEVVREIQKQYAELSKKFSR